MPEGQTNDFYHVPSNLVRVDVPPYLLASVYEAAAEAACTPRIGFKDVVKAHLRVINAASGRMKKITSD